MWLLTELRSNSHRYFFLILLLICLYVYVFISFYMYVFLCFSHDMNYNSYSMRCISFIIIIFSSWTSRKLNIVQGPKKTKNLSCWEYRFLRPGLGDQKSGMLTRSFIKFLLWSWGTTILWTISYNHCSKKVTILRK